MIIDLADKFIDRLIQLATYKKQRHIELMEKYATPVFEEFERIHFAYLDSFSRYRELIMNTQNVNWISSLQDLINKENLFSFNVRAKAIRLAEAGPDGIADPFVISIGEYLMDDRVVDSTYPGDFNQRWRNSLFEVVYRISEEDWHRVAIALDMDRKAFLSKAKKIRNQYPFPKKVGESDATKRALAIYALDSIVLRMQKQYDKVCFAYANKLKKTLST